MSGKKLRVVMLLSGGELALWRGPLARALRAEGHDVAFALGPTDPAPRGAALLAEFEALVYRGQRAQASERPAHELIGGGCDLCVAGEAGKSFGDAPTLALSCDGQGFALGAAAALLDGRAPRLDALLQSSDAPDGRLLASALAAVEEPHLYTRSLARVSTRMAQTALAAIGRLAAEGFEASALPADADPPRPARAPEPLAFALRGLAGKIESRLLRLARRDARWRIAWRPTNESIPKFDGWGVAPFFDLPDDGRRYFADPFAFAHEGRTYVLCEEYPFATARAILSVFEMVDGRPNGTPRPILERPYHLSYPMVFAHEGAIWMIPETSAAGRIELYRADSFPDRWSYVATLVDGVRASDATLLIKDGTFWLFATDADPEGSSWDRLCLWSASRLSGPWSPHPGNPVLIDASSARPAGMPVFHGGRWLRPAQDCSRIYGGGLAWRRIDRLDAEGFAESPFARLAPPSGSGAIGVHTVNCAGGIEVIDLFGPPKPRVNLSSNSRKNIYK